MRRPCSFDHDVAPSIFLILSLRVHGNRVHYPDGLVSDVCVDFLKCILVKDPTKRMTLSEMLDHPWLASHVREMMDYSMGVPLDLEEDELGDALPVTLCEDETNAEITANLDQWVCLSDVGVLNRLS